MDIVFKDFHVINFIAGTVVGNRAHDLMNKLDIYINSVVQHANSKKNNKAFRFRTVPCNVYNLTNTIVEDLDSESSKALAVLAGIAEKEKERKYGHLHPNEAIKRQNGGLIIAVYEDSSARYFVVAEVDYQSFLDKSDYTDHEGLPYERYVLKSCIIPLNDSGVDCSKQISIYDTNATLSHYWWYDFLELEEINTDVFNTETSFKAYVMLINNKTSRYHKADCVYLRNRLVSYYHTHDNYSHDEIMEQVFYGYAPQDKNLNYAALVEMAKVLPDEKGFDKTFSIKEENIEKGFKQKIPLGHNMELNLLSDVPNLEKILIPLMENNIKYLKIQSDDGYDELVKNEQ